MSARPGKGAPLPGPAKEVTNSIGMKLRLIPPGKFLMGSPETEAERLPNEGPQRGVTLTRAFYLGVFLVTQAEYRRLMGQNPSFFSSEGGGRHKVAGMDTDRFPVEMVSWHDAIEFCEKLSALPEEKAAGRVYRLPTEAEWEYACRADTNTPFWWGDKASSLQANFNGNRPYGGADKGPNLERTCRVGSYKANPWGLYDMHGHISQWCNDWYGEKYYAQGDNRDPQGPGPEQGARVLRGNGWRGRGSFCRAACRGYGAPDIRCDEGGFRVACSVP
jgi:formylglycine-generating enzyme required for sulfatase activity